MFSLNYPLFSSGSKIVTVKAHSKKNKIKLQEKTTSLNKLLQIYLSTVQAHRLHFQHNQLRKEVGRVQGGGIAAVSEGRGECRVRQ